MATYAGDFNLDGVVNDLDLDIWKANFGTGTAWQMGDANYDGVVNGLDLDLWQQNVGKLPQLAVGDSWRLRRRRSSRARNAGAVGRRIDWSVRLRLEKAKVMRACTSCVLPSRVVVFWRDCRSSQVTAFSASRRVENCYFRL